VRISLEIGCGFPRIEALRRAPDGARANSARLRHLRRRSCRIARSRRINSEMGAAMAEMTQTGGG
jgi:hypothetical protein